MNGLGCRSWMMNRRSRYHRLRGATTPVRRNLKIARLGGGCGGGRGVQKFVKAVRKVMAGFHEGYVRVMVKVAEKVAGGGDGRVWELPCGDRVDGRVLLELYSKLVAERAGVSIGSGQLSDQLRSICNNPTQLKVGGTGLVLVG